jgi:hypothetical protein
MVGMPHNAVNIRATLAHHLDLARGFGKFTNFVLTRPPRRGASASW